ncbi:NIPSNAP family containing protein [Klebsiella indica]|uniref:NIPSNAP family containing protein n=1 Tax=Klebsiella indica TaxID=2582917 RepID=A0A5R9LKI5_9ENTR|nr:MULTISPECIES: NIPSNAP family protein [Klebsiella]TLV19970.1 NIPSNAP family containing protein [Klebsiella indica]
MSTFEIRTYTLKSAAAAMAYQTIWLKHIESLHHFGVTTHGVFSAPDDPRRVIALVSYEEGASAGDVTERYMASELFQADMAGFDFSDFVSVEATALLPAPFSPLK